MPYLVEPNIQDVKVELEIPKPIMDFLHAAEQFAGVDPKKYLERIIIDGVFADVDITVDGASFWDPKTVRHKYGLNQLHYVNQIHDCPGEEV
jgi:hypothetical protein